MYELVYTSVTTEVLSRYELLGLLDESRKRNKNLGVTGILLYDSREIVQLLEGDELIVKDLYQSIKADSRHTSVEVAYQNRISVRTFDEWFMAFKSLSDQDKLTLLPGYWPVSKVSSLRQMIHSDKNTGASLFLALSKEYEVKPCSAFNL